MCIDKTKVMNFLNLNKYDAWIVYQFIDLNPTFLKIFGKENIVSRRAFYIIDKEGNEYLIRSQVDGGLSKMNIKQYTYLTYESLTAILKTQLKNYKKVLMEYSPNSQIPHISRVDAGTIELIRSQNIEVYSSGDLLQSIISLSNNEVESHKRAAVQLDEVKNKTFEFIRKQFSSNLPLAEYDIMTFILEEISRRGLETIYEPTVNFNENSSKNHYQPDKENSKTLNGGDYILLDLWLKEKGDENIYADIAWALTVGTPKNNKVIEVFNILKEARDNSVEFIKNQVKKKKQIRGFEVDKISQDVIRSHGYYDYIAHRLGHSIGTFVHGTQTHLDNFENIDNRLIVPPHLTSVEPGILIPDELGMHLELNLLILEEEVIVTTEVQDHLIII